MEVMNMAHYIVKPGDKGTLVPQTARDAVVIETQTIASPMNGEPIQTGTLKRKDGKTARFQSQLTGAYAKRAVEVGERVVAWWSDSRLGIYHASICNIDIT